MPEIEVIIFVDDDGTVPFLDWMDHLPPKVQDKCTAKIERLAEMGYELRRPEADTLRDGIHELRIGFQGINYRILYFFHGRQAVLSHGCKKESDVPPKQIDLAIERKQRYQMDPERYGYKE
jgi:hypothetical protein